MKYYTTNEVAEILKLNPETIRRKIKAGKIKAVSIGTRYRISEEEVKRFMEG